MQEKAAQKRVANTGNRRQTTAMCFRLCLFFESLAFNFGV
jgi:hypothetical protein